MFYESKSLGFETNSVAATREARAAKMSPQARAQTNAPSHKAAGKAKVGAGRVNSHTVRVDTPLIKTGSTPRLRCIYSSELY